MKLKELFLEILSEKMVTTRATDSQFAKYVAYAYKNAPIHDSEADGAYSALNSSNHTLWKRLLSKIKVIFTTESVPTSNSITIAGKQYELVQMGDPYKSSSEMKADVNINRRLYIMLDHSDHPYFSVEDNIVFRAVHDYIVHVLGNKPFGLHGEEQAYNLHAKLVPVEARGAVFTEIIGQASWQTVHGSFPTQKAVLLHGFDYVNVGVVSDDVIKQFNKDNHE